MEYRPLDQTKDEIRVIHIRPSKPHPAQRGRNSWAPSIIDYDKTEHELVSSVRIELDNDLVECTLEYVSLGDVVEEYREYLAMDDSEDDQSWYEYAFNKLPQDSRSTLSQLPTWRTRQWDNEHGEDMLSEARCDLGSSSCFIPRYKWGDFEALSYTWGTDMQKGEIVVDGALISVHKNIEDALRALRALPETQTGMRYWIDALCINQADIPERNAQVSRMQSLYEAAWSVVVWLGPGLGEDGVRACDTVSGISHLDCSLRQTQYMLHIVPTYEGLDWKPLVALMKHPYWYRVWIIQELAMNHDNTIFICGDRAFRRQELVYVLKFATLNSMALQSFVEKGTDTSTGGGQLPSGAGGNKLFWLFQRNLHLLELDGRKGKQPSVEFTFSLVEGASATDPKDKVYGILALLPMSLAADITPDYHLPVEEVVRDFSEKLLRLNGLEILLAWPASGLNLPSWCLDLSRPYGRHHMQWLRRRTANKGQRFGSQISPDGQTLQCTGIKVDMIRAVTSTKADSNSDASRAQEFVHLVENKTTNTATEGDIPTSLIDALGETLIVGHPYETSRPRSTLTIPWVRFLSPSERDSLSEDEIEDWELFWKTVELQGYFEGFDKFRQANASFDICGHPLRDFFPQSRPGLHFKTRNQITKTELLVTDIRLTAISLVGRELAITVNNRLASIPADAQVGDVIAILDCPFPVLLRSHGEGYEYVGECYLHGIMDGEVFEDGSRLPFEKFALI